MTKLVVSSDLVAPDRLFSSDNASGAHPLVIEALASANTGHALAYGYDKLTRDTENAFSQLFGREVITKFVFGGTGANVLALATMLRSAEAVVCTSSAHIAVDETGAPEKILGAKLIDLESVEGKLLPQQLRSLAHLFGSEHHVQPGVVSISQPTEVGTLYSAQEVTELCQTAHEMGMLVHMDGARIANATAALGATRKALRSFTIDAGVDVLSFGGTKTGLVFGEAVIYFNTALAERSLFIRKQVTQTYSKMRFISAQYLAFLENDLFISLGKQANSAAVSLYEAVRTIESLQITHPPQVNSIYPILDPMVQRALQDWSFFWDWDVTCNQARWMTAWDISSVDINRFVAGIRSLVT
ncbi:MAG: threonine aldolase [Actinobacteria bacterium]|nr:MAG: threonine aldolase [Actinomycetota bacterium]